MGILKRFRELKNVKPAPEKERIKLEKGDFPAMLIAALVTLVIPTVLILGLMVLVMMFIFRLF